MFINNRSQPALLTFVKLKGFSMFQQYCLWRNSFEQIHKILYEKCSWKKIKFCLFNKKLDKCVMLKKHINQLNPNIIQSIRTLIPILSERPFYVPSPAIFTLQKCST
jgi:hypothetical protein